METNANNLIQNGQSQQLAAPSAAERVLMEIPIVGAGMKQQWAEQREDTAIQRQLRDMQLAGLNPILAYSGGGASAQAAMREGSGQGVINSAISAANTHERKKQAKRQKEFGEKLQNIAAAMEILKYFS